MGSCSAMLRWSLRGGLPVAAQRHSSATSGKRVGGAHPQGHATVMLRGARRVAASLKRAAGSSTTRCAHTGGQPPRWHNRVSVTTTLALSLEHIATLSCFHASRGSVRAAARGKPTLERSACGRAYCRPMQPLHLASSRGWSRLQASGFSRSETAQTQRGCSLHEPPQALPVWCCSLLSAHSHAPPAIALSFHIPAAGCHSSRGQRPSSSWQGEAVLGTQVRLGASGPALRVAADSPSSRHVTSTSRTQSGVLARMTSTPAPRST
jgi:hypothetical protein